MNVPGREPHPPLTETIDSEKPSTVIPETVTAHLDLVYAQYGSRELLADVLCRRMTR